MIQPAAALPENAQRALSPLIEVVRINPASTNYKPQPGGGYFAVDAVLVAIASGLCPEEIFP